MPLLKVGKHHIDTDKILSVITPSAHGSPTNPAVSVRYVSGPDDVFQGEEAEVLRQWLASQVEKPDTLPTRAIVKK